MFRKIMVAFNGTAEAKSALHFGISLARQFGSKLQIVAVVTTTSNHDHMAPSPDDQRFPADSSEELRNEAKRGLSRAFERARAAGVESTAMLLDGEEVEELIGAVRREGPDLLVIGFQSNHPEAYFRRTPYYVGQRIPCALLAV